MSNQSQFIDPEFLARHIKDTLAFYHPHCVDKEGGFYHYFLDDGQVYDHQSRHLVSSCRFVFNYAMAAIAFDCPEYLPIITHGLDYIEQIHKNPKTKGYAWELKERGIVMVDDTNHCYGLAFVMLAHSVALKAGIDPSGDNIEQVWLLLEQHYWDDPFGLYRDEYNGDFSICDKYRGQNANMHMCEALLTAYEATLNEKFLSRAYTLAYNMCVRQANLGEGLIWEHYHSDWQIDLQYNLDNPQHLFRPWGFQPGHQTEWAKLLLILHRHRPEAWMIEKAGYLFDKALACSWDQQYGGICYSFAPNGKVCDDDKYFWVQAESVAAAALLALATGEDKYWDWYNKIWEYAWNHMIDHQYGAWYRILDHQNNRYSTQKSPAGKTDYHTMGACYEVLRAMKLKGD